MTYDNSLKGFLDLGVQGGTDHDEGGDSDAATSDAGSTSSGRRSPRVSHASLADKRSRRSWRSSWRSRSSTSENWRRRSRVRSGN